MKLITGLGNIGDKYCFTRHNAGFMVLDMLAIDNNLSFKQDTKLKSFITKLKMGEDDILLAKPTTFMNLSGEAVRAIMDYYKIPVNDILIIYDDISLDLFRAGKGTIRYKGKWELIDRVLVSGNLDSICRMDICAVPFLLVEDSASPGKKPFRTYSGPRYNGGVSDHLPVIAFFPRTAENDNLRQ